MIRALGRPRRRSALIVALVVALVAGTATAASALWATSGTTGSSVTIGKVIGSLSGTSAMTTTFSSTVTSSTAPLTLTNSGSLPGTYSASATATQGHATTRIARAIRVVAWPVSGTSACTASAAVGSGSLTGTWAAMPGLTGTLAVGQSAVWCLRSTPQSGAPASATTNPTISLVLATGSWRSSPVSGGFYLNTSAEATGAPASQCLGYDGNYHVRISWDTSTRSPDTFYGLAVAGTRVNPAAQGYTGYIDLAGSDVPTSVAADGPARVDVAVLASDGTPTGELAATGTVTFGMVDGSRTVVCGG